MRITRIAATAGGIAVVGALTLAGCASSGDDGDTSGDSSAIITVNGSEPQNPLIPGNTNETGGGKIIDNLFAGLVYYTADGSAENDVAESVETDNAQDYTITIRSGLTFSDGSPVTAESFAKSWDWTADAANAALNQYFFDDITGFV